MNLERIRLRHFRNYHNVTVEFHHGINYLLGRNAQGKTNLLESIFYLSTTKTHRDSEDKDLIQSGFDFFGIDGFLEKKGRMIEMTCNVGKNGKNLYLYRNPVKKVSDFIGECNAVLFCPDDMGLFSAQPRFRRKFIDLELGKLSKSYMTKLNDYYRLLKERNAALKKSGVPVEYFEILNEQMAILQCVILKQRTKFMNDLIEVSAEFYHELSDDQSDLKVDYHTCVDVNVDEKVMKAEFLKKYHDTFSRDLLFKSTSIGIHKDDFVILMNGLDTSNYASQGQKRTVLLSMKIGIVMMIHRLIKDYPILLLDDVFSELDSIRREKLLKLLPEEVQIFISATDLVENIQGREVSLYLIENGQIKKA